MFKLKRKGSDKACRLHKAIENIMSPLLRNCGEKLQLQRRIRIANIWARRHPKALMGYYLTFAIGLLAITITIDLMTSGTKKDHTLDLKSIPSMSHRLQSLNLTEIQNEKIKMELTELGLKGQKLYNELDSLMKIPNKTHADSVRIIQTYNILNDTFNTNRHELQKD